MIRMMPTSAATAPRAIDPNTDPMTELASMMPLRAMATSMVSTLVSLNCALTV